MLDDLDGRSGSGTVGRSGKAVVRVLHPDFHHQVVGSMNFPRYIAKVVSSAAGKALNLNLQSHTVVCHCNTLSVGLRLPLDLEGRGLVYSCDDFHPRSLSLPR